MEADKFPEPLWGRSEVLRSCFLLVPIPRREERKVTCGGYGRGMWTEPSREQRQEQREVLTSFTENVMAVSTVVRT